VALGPTLARSRIAAGQVLTLETVDDEVYWTLCKVSKDTRKGLLYGEGRPKGLGPEVTSQVLTAIGELKLGDRRLYRWSQFSLLALMLVRILRAVAPKSRFEVGVCVGYACEGWLGTWNGKTLELAHDVVITEDE
jgi:hypothetical protein